MEILLFFLLWYQAPEKHRGPASAELPQIVVQEAGPLVVPTDIVVRALFAVCTAYTSVLILGGKWIWKKRGDEVTAIKEEVAKLTANLGKVVTYETYARDKIETRSLIREVGKKVDANHNQIMERLLDITTNEQHRNR